MRWVVVALPTATAAAFAWLACSVDTSTPPPDASTCSSPCAVGLECTAGPIAPVCQVEADAEDTGIVIAPPNDAGLGCAYNPFSAGQRNTLIQGFAAGELDLTYDPQNGQATVSPPADTVVVACALFGCVPSFQSSVQQNFPVHQITNFDTCVLVFDDDLVPPFSVFSVLDNPNLYPVDCGATPQPAGCPSAVLDELLIGCWAYNATSVTVASPLEQIDPRTTYLFGRVVSDCAEANGRSCLIPSSNRLGTCVGASCRFHCQTAQDCEVQLGDDASTAGELAVASDADTLDATDGGDAEGGPVPLPACGFACEPVLPRHDIGVCSPVGGDP